MVTQGNNPESIRSTPLLSYSREEGMTSQPQVDSAEEVSKRL